MLAATAERDEPLEGDGSATPAGGGLTMLFAPG
jgi:hypothetical protein